MPLIRRTVVRDEGVQQGAVNTLDFAGAGVTVAVAGGVATVTVPGGSGSTVSGQSEIDFGVFPGKAETSLAVAAPGIVAGSRIVLSLAAVATADHGVEDVILEELDLLPGAPSVGVGFTIFARVRSQFTSDEQKASGRRGSLGSFGGNQMSWGRFLVNWSYT
jgi:hypothetical protein